MTTQPPRLASWLLALALPRTLREPVLGDLAESYSRRVATEGRWAANRIYWREGWAAVRNLGDLSNEPTTLTPPRSPFDGIGADARFAFRLYARRPATAAIVIATLGLAIGGTTAIFSVVKPVLLDALPYPYGQRLVYLWERYEDGTTSNLGFATFADLRERATTLDRAAAVSFWSPTLLGGGNPVRLVGQRVSASFFGMLGVTPALGRDFLPTDDQNGAARVVIISSGLWHRQFGADPAIVGTTVSLDGNPNTVIGVLPDDFESLVSQRVDIWGPLRYDGSLPQACRDCRHLRAVARLGPGIGLAAAGAEVDRLGAALRAEYPKIYGANGMVIEPLKTNLTKGARGALWLLFAGVGLILALACANVANLLLGQAVQRRHEFGVRMALGSGRDRLIRQIVIEALLLGLGGAVVALILTGVGTGLIRAAATGLPRSNVVALDWSVWLFGGLTGLTAGIAFGLLPARASLSLAGDGLRDTARVTRRHGVRRTLVVAEVALASVLVIGALLLTRSMSRLLAVDLGFADEGLITASLQTAGPSFQSDSSVWQYYRQVDAAVRQLPGVRTAGLVSMLPLGGNFDYYGVRSESHIREQPDDAVSAARFSVTPGYLQTMGIRLIEGRMFSAADRTGSDPVAIVNEWYAKSQFPGRSALGERISIGGEVDGKPFWRTIVGVVGNVKEQRLDQGEGPQVYHPHDQWIFGDDLALVARSEGDPAALASQIQRTIRAIHPDPTIEQVIPMTAVVSGQLRPRRLVLSFFLGFALLALTLAAVGIYGVMASGVAEQRRELGIRAALGASGESLRRAVLRESAGLGLVGMVAGLTAGTALARLLGAKLYGFTVFDPIAYGATAAALLGTVLLSAWVPAARAARHDPAVTLRSE